MKKPSKNKNSKTVKNVDLKNISGGREGGVKGFDNIDDLMNDLNSRNQKN